ncbi:MAG: hypothetical protein K2X47_03890, partial [Bdellovibrionales bacterium]|nr:hypothetical protein [Bdellovibrionales bacterium]
KGRIQEIEKALLFGALQLDKNNTALNTIKAKAVSQIRDLEMEIAKAYLLSLFVSEEAKKARARNQTKLADTLESEVVVNVQGKLNAALGLYGVLTAGVQAINQLVSVNQKIIQQAQSLQTTAIPGIAVMESQRAANQMARETAQRQERISSFFTEMFKQLPAQTAETNRLLENVLRNPTVKAEDLAAVHEQLAAEEERKRQAMIEIGKELAEGNQRLIAVVNSARRSFESHQVGNAVNSRMSGSGKQ